MTSYSCVSVVFIITEIVIIPDLPIDPSWRDRMVSLIGHVWSGDESAIPEVYPEEILILSNFHAETKMRTIWFEYPRYQTKAWFFWLFAEFLTFAAYWQQILVLLEFEPEPVILQSISTGQSILVKSTVSHQLHQIRIKSKSNQSGWRPVSFWFDGSHLTSTCITEIHTSRVTRHPLIAIPSKSVHTLKQAIESWSCFDCPISLPGSRSWAQICRHQVFYSTLFIKWMKTTLKRKWEPSDYKFLDFRQ